MTESEGVVASVDGEFAWVTIRKAPACGNCDSQGACGSGLLADAVGPKRYRVPNPGHARVGDTVVLSVPAGSLVKAAMVSYLGPLMLALVGVGAGLGFGVFLLRAVSSRLGRAEPMLSMRVKRDVILLKTDARS
jgi:sigma-E factor negative regulatory protein RseC